MTGSYDKNGRPISRRAFLGTAAGSAAGSLLTTPGDVLAQEQHERVCLNPAERVVGELLAAVVLLDRGRALRRPAGAAHRSPALLPVGPGRRESAEQSLHE